MKITTDEVRRIATLACLEFDDAGQSRMAAEMSGILDYVDQIRDAEVGAGDGAESGSSAPLRADEPGASLPAGEVERAAPRFALGQFVVPRVIGGE